MNLLALQIWLADNAGLSDAAAAAALNAPATMNQPVPLGNVKLPLYQDATPCAMLRIKAQTVIADTTLQGLQLAAQQADAYLNDPHMQNIDFTNPVVSAGLALLVQGGVLSQALVNQITALGTINTTVAAAAGVVPVGVLVRTRQVTQARAGL